MVVLAVARKLTGGSPALNFMGAVLSGVLENSSTHHVPRVLNPRPKLLEGVKIRDLPNVGFEKLCTLPSLGQHPELWGKDSDQRCVFEHL